MGIALVRQIVTGDALAQLGAAQLPVGVDQLGDQADLQLVELGFGGLGLGVAGLQAALDAAEQVQLPGHVQAQVVAFGIDPPLGDAGLLCLADIGAGASGDRGKAIVGVVVADRPRRAQTRIGDAQFAVLGQGLYDQSVQRRVLELMPPGGFEARAVVVAVLGMGDACGLGLRRPIVRADGAAGHGQGEQGKGEELHARISLNTALRAARFSTKARITR